MIAVSNNRRTVIPHNLKPRAIRHEPTEAQIEQERHRQKRLCLEALLSAYFKPRPALEEDVYGGRMNKPVDRSDSVTGCELEPDFCSFMETHHLIDHEEARRLWRIEQALESLQETYDFCHLVVTTHRRTGEALVSIAKRFGQGEKRVNEAYDDGIEYLLALLNPN